jgi:hypothetical protein
LKGERVKSHYILGALAVALAAILILSDRPWGMTSVYRIEEIATLPEDARLAPVRRYTEIGSGIFPYVGREGPPAPGTRQPLKLGFAYRELSAFRMPFWASSDFGMVTYYEAPWGRQFAVITPGQKPLLDQLAGAPMTQDRSFRWYLHLWGWLFVLGLAVWTLVKRREVRAAEDAYWAS